MNSEHTSTTANDTAPAGHGTAHAAPVIRPLGTLAELTLGSGVGMADGFDGFGTS